jgi:glutaredoxin-like YruB-family protein
MAKIRIFSTPVCPYCVTLKEFLKERGFEFEDINVASDVQAREEMVKKSNQMGVPVIEIDGQIIVGFDRRKVVEALGIKD